MPYLRLGSMPNLRMLLQPRLFKLQLSIPRNTRGIKMKPDPSIVLCELQFGYMTQSPLRVREGFMDKLYENIKALKLPEFAEDELLALGIEARSSKPEQRCILCNRALDILDAIKKLKKRMKKKA